MDDDLQPARSVLGPVVVACELRQANVARSAGRPHYFRSVLRDQIGTLWECEHQHQDQDDAHACAKVEYERRIEAGELISRRRRPSQV